MMIEKNGTVYSVSEFPSKWVVKTNSGKLSASYDVSKELCATESDLQDYIQSSDLF